jgi:hypothetical protein
MKWIHSDKELGEFFEHANSIHPSIKFTHEVSKTKMSFLDTTTTVKEGNMTTDLYSKPTDKHQYLSPSNCHPKHCFMCIPFSQTIRVKRICSSVETTKQRLGDLRHHLKRRGYNDKVIESVFSKASEINRNDRACCNCKQHLQRLSPHALHWPTVDEGLDTAALTSVSLMLLGRRNATTGGSGNNFASASLF